MGIEDHAMQVGDIMAFLQYAMQIIFSLMMLSYIDASDIAQVAYRVLTEEGHENKAYYLSGPEALSDAEITDILSSVTGKSIKYVDAPVEAARDGMQKAGMPAEIVEALLEHYQMMKLGHTAKVSSTIEEITGQKATFFETFAQAKFKV
jgi:uncharacterized protein YbjT (DUF2867 family)